MQTEKVHYNRRAETIRSKLIDTFYLHDLLQKGQIVTSKYTVQDVLGERISSTMTDSHCLVTYSSIIDKRGFVSKEQQCLTRVRNCHAKYPPMNIFAHWILDSEMFGDILFVLIIMNFLVLMLEAEIYFDMHPRMEMLKLVVETVDWCILIIFYLEIILKWLDNFNLFWKNSWNIFNFVITTLPFLSEIVVYIAGDAAVDFGFMKLIGKARILICLKTVNQFPQIRLIMLVITKAMRGTSYILLLFFLFMFIFAVAGGIVFEEFNETTVEGLKNKESFKDMPNSLISLFILYTMDHWFDLIVDIRKVENLDNILCGIYVIAWLIVGSFFFRNIFVGVMVSTYQDLRNDLSEEVRRIENQQKADNFKAEIIPKSMQQQTREIDWETFVLDNMQFVKEQRERESVTWPKDLLFAYFELMEKLQYNLHDWTELQSLTDEIFGIFHDDLAGGCKEVEAEILL